METVFCTISFCEYIYGISAYANFFMVHCGFGVRDFQNATKLELAEIYVPSGFYGYDENLAWQLSGTGVALGYSYDGNLGAFVADAVAPTHAKMYSPIFLHAGGEEFEAYGETQNIQFIPEKFTSNVISAFLKVGISVGRYLFRWITRSNYRFQDQYHPWDMGELEETGSFDATTIRMNGNRKYKLNNVATQVPTSDCVRFRIDAIPRGGKWRVFDIELKSSGVVSETTEIANAD